MTVEEFKAIALEWYNVALAYLGEASILIQLGLICLAGFSAQIVSVFQNQINDAEPLLRRPTGFRAVLIAFSHLPQQLCTP